MLGDDRRGLLLRLRLGCRAHHPRKVTAPCPWHSLRRWSILPGLPPLPPFGSPRALAHSPIMMPENARTRAATSAEVTTERIRESGRRGSGVGDTARQIPTGHQ